MNIFIFATLFIFNFLLSSWQSYAQASSYYLNYKHKIGASDFVLLEDFFENTIKTPLSNFEIAKIDLNLDNLAEFVVRYKKCPTLAHKCPHYILALKSNKIIQLGIIHAKLIEPAQTYSYGIQDFLAFQNDNNDYDSVRYVWSPTAVAYVKDEAR